MESGRPPRNGIDHLFPGIGAERFFREFWPISPIVEHHVSDRIVYLLDWAASLNIADLMADLDDEKTIVYRRIAQGPARQEAVPPKEALSLWGDGNTIALEHIARASAEVYSMARELRCALGYAQRTADVALIAAHAGEAVPWHFDGVELIVLHLTGEKTWWLSRNDDVTHPTQAYFVGVGGVTDRDRAAGRRAGYLAGDLSPDPAHETCHRLRPGSAMFLPKGLWHRTESDGPSLSLTFKIPVPTLRARLLQALSRATLRQSAWRAPLPFRDGGFGSAEPAVAEALEDLAETLSPQLLADNSSERFQTRPGGLLDVRRDDGVIYVAGRGRWAMPPYPLPAAVLPILRHISDRDDVFDLEDICAACPSAPRSLVSETVTTLLDNNILEEAP